MKVQSAYSFLTRPPEGDGVPLPVKGATLKLEGDLFDMLNGLFLRSTADCNLDIAFNARDDGVQENLRRSQVVGLALNPTMEAARDIADALQAATTRVSGMGLMFILLGSTPVGSTGKIERRIYLARFPTTMGITAEDDGPELKVDYLERVFLKNANAYKAVVWDGVNLKKDFWKGRATDKQVNDRAFSTSSYWLRTFLDCDFMTTAAAGTMRLAKALRETINQTENVALKEELIAAAKLAPNLDGEVMTIDTFHERFKLSEGAKDAMLSTLSKPSLSFSTFEFSAVEFAKQLKFKTLHMDSGAVLTAPAGKWDKCFELEDVNEETGEKTYRTTGKVSNALIRGSV